jgi:UDP-3-O-[3-hydroxymyristoyl] glucosamine N-acyltransferase
VPDRPQLRDRPHCIIVGQTGLSGSVTLEDFAVLGARTGILPHVTVGKGAMLASRSSVYNDVPAGAEWGGFPAQEKRQWMREMLTLRRLAARDQEPRATPEIAKP